MSKRRDRADSLEISQAEFSQPKRPRENHSFAQDLDVESVLDVFVDGTSEVFKSDIVPKRDSKFFYEDGSVVLLVGGVLFKIHASLIKAQSDGAQNIISMYSGEQKDNTEEDPICVPDVQASAFQHLMQMIYSPPSDNNMSRMRTDHPDKHPMQHRFIFYSDVARLAHRFNMQKFKSWATDRLRELLGLLDMRESCSMFEGSYEIPFILFETLCYARTIGDATIEYETRNLIQHHHLSSKVVYPAILFTSFKDAILREFDSASVGFLFLMLLNLGHKAWEKPPFTRRDLAALCIAQTYLTPLPGDLGNGLKMPIMRSLDPPALDKLFEKDACSDVCREGIKAVWNNTFNTDYYKNILSKVPLKATAALGKLPHMRLTFATSVRGPKQCQAKCGIQVLQRLDGDLERLFTKLASYKQDIE